jgi:hypothetical protein
VPCPILILALVGWREIEELSTNKEVRCGASGVDEVAPKLKRTSKQVRRAQILRKADADGLGWSHEKICEAFGSREQTVEKVRQRLVLGGFELAWDGITRQTPPTAPV